MIATCANPACNVPFRYFRSGKIFMLEANHVDPGSRTDPFEAQNRVLLVVWGMRPGHALDANDGRGSRSLPISPVF
jgi:hypothetical protein